MRWECTSPTMSNDLERDVRQTRLKDQYRPRKAGSALSRETAEGFRERFPKLGTLMDEAELDVLTFTAFPEDHWKQIGSTNPIERVNKEIERRSNVSGIFPNDGAIIRLAGDLMAEQNEKWRLTRRCTACENLARVTAPDPRKQTLGGKRGGVTTEIRRREVTPLDRTLPRAESMELT